MNRILITAPASGSGKTTMTCALLSAMSKRGIDIAAFKCGPDYIDPMFHEKTAEVKAYNLDPFFLDEMELREQFARHAGRDISIIEGAMGYYDGIANTDRASSYEVARVTATPAILVCDARKSANSIAAVIEGFKAHKPDSGIVGVIFNGIRESRYSDLKNIVRKIPGIVPLGYLPYDKAVSIGSRHLGLVTVNEIADIRQKLKKLGDTASKTIDIDGVIKLASLVPPLIVPLQREVTQEMRIKIAVALDNAFCFTYKETLERFERYGAELKYFSPLDDERLPSGTDALYLCGGYPELHADKLAKNKTMLEDIRNAVNSGVPTIAEDGGFMLLHNALDGHTMAGIINASVYKTEKLQRFGYITLMAKSDNLLCAAGEEIRAHEFHYWDSDNPGGGFTAKKAGRGTQYDCAYATDTLYAGFPHVYVTDEMAKRFIEKAKK